MATTTTYQVLTPYQIDALKEVMMCASKVEQIGINTETTELVVEYITYHNEAYKTFIPTVERVSKQDLFPWKLEWITAPGLEQLGSKNTENDRGTTA